MVLSYLSTSVTKDERLADSVEPLSKCEHVYEIYIYFLLWSEVLFSVLSFSKHQDKI